MWNKCKCGRLVEEGLTECALCKNERETVSSNRLFGVIEWINTNGGTVKKFNDHVLFGEVNGLKYRYFITEGWIGLKTKNCRIGKSLAYETLEDFQTAVAENSPNDKNEDSERRTK